MTSTILCAAFFLVWLGTFSILQAQAPTTPSTTGARQPGPIAASQAIFGRHDFIEYVAGNLPIVISVPHGGYLRPTAIPDRVLGTAGHQDTFTQELARDIIDLFRSQTGKVPHVVINRLHRNKLDANRELFDAAQDDSLATDAWIDFHSFIDSAEQRVEREFGSGLYIDLHGHRHTWQAIELGYLLVSNQLKLGDAGLDSSVQPATTSLGLCVRGNPRSLSRQVRGPQSFGAALEHEGFEVVPGPAHPDPGTEPYFSGGYNLEQHSAFSGKKVWGIQVELPTGIREDAVRRHAFAIAFVKGALGFLSSKQK